MADVADRRLGSLKLKEESAGFSKRPSTIRKRSRAYSTPVGTVNYISPEAIRGDFSDAAMNDVFSFSVIMLECMVGITARKIGTKENEKDALHKLHSADKRYEIAPEVLAQYPELVELIQRCWSVDIEKRPMFEEIAEVLPKIMSKQTVKRKWDLVKHPSKKRLGIKRKK